MLQLGDGRRHQPRARSQARRGGRPQLAPQKPLPHLMRSRSPGSASRRTSHPCWRSRRCSCRSGGPEPRPRSQIVPRSHPAARPHPRSEDVDDCPGSFPRHHAQRSRRRRVGAAVASALVIVLTLSGCVTAFLPEPPPATSTPTGARRRCHPTVLLADGELERLRRWHAVRDGRGPAGLGGAGIRNDRAGHRAATGAGREDRIAARQPGWAGRLRIQLRQRLGRLRDR